MLLQGFQLVSGRYPEYPESIKKGQGAMPGKQDRYRKRKAEQGFQRIELLVPEAAAPYLKAYARALRDAHALGLEPPLFDGMRLSTDEVPPPPVVSSSLPDKIKHDKAEQGQSKQGAAESHKIRRAEKSRWHFTKLFD